jgi:broad specificity phosphatase PhoE
MSAEVLRLFVFARHAESTANTAHAFSSDPARPVALTERGRVQARALGAQLANVNIDLAVGTRFQRTQETIGIALHGRRVPVLIEPGFDELQAGDLDGAPMEAYWSWRRQHTLSDRLPHGESPDDASRRYANALRSLLARTEAVTLVVLHESALCYIALAAGAGESRLPAGLSATRFRFCSTGAPPGVPQRAWRPGHGHARPAQPGLPPRGRGRRGRRLKPRPVRYQDDLGSRSPRRFFGDRGCQSLTSGRDKSSRRLGGMPRLPGQAAGGPRTAASHVGEQPAADEIT